VPILAYCDTFESYLTERFSVKSDTSAVFPGGSTTHYRRTGSAVQNLCFVRRGILSGFREAVSYPQVLSGVPQTRIQTTVNSDQLSEPEG
jgi:hypothetical protein